MSLVAEVLRSLDAILLWGFLATGVMTTMLEASQFLGWSRMSLPFLFGTFFTGSRRRAIIIGFTLYLIGGWLFAFLYALAFESVGFVSWWLGAGIGFAHALFLVIVFLPNLPYIHPRMSTEYSGPTSKRRLEPPGPMGLNYGRQTPLTTVLAQTLFGLILGMFYPG